jgi:hypothetical protein
LAGASVSEDKARYGAWGGSSSCTPLPCATLDFPWPRSRTTDTEAVSIAHTQFFLVFGANTITTCVLILVLHGRQCLSTVLGCSGPCCDVWDCHCPVALLCAPLAHSPVNVLLCGINIQPFDPLSSLCRPFHRSLHCDLTTTSSPDSHPVWAAGRMCLQVPCKIPSRKDLLRTT